jgi:hypothetical protein
MRHPAFSSRHRLPDGGCALSGLREWSCWNGVGRISVYAPSGNISAAPIAGWRLRLMRPTGMELLERRRPDKRLRAIRQYHRGTLAGWRLRLIRPTKMSLQRQQRCFYLRYGSDGVVSPLKSANRSVNDKVWTPWMADRGEPRQGLVPEWNE